MKFYLLSPRFLDPERIVSIPNGMKFYHSISSVTFLKNPVSIPNGMKFYRGVMCCIFFMWTFQFPTGWNSTSFLAAIAAPKASFNSQRDEILLRHCNYPVVLSPRFNSQRDEILRLPREKDKEWVVFQFPTGWNSTVIAPRNKRCDATSFNSQRDEILRYRCLRVRI